MGTTQRMTPGVSGEPNWGDLSKRHFAEFNGN